MSGTITVLDFPAIITPNIGDYAYVIRGSGVGRDKKILVTDLITLSDTDGSNKLIPYWNENDSADRILKFKVHGADRNLDLTGDLTLNAGLIVNSGSVTLVGPGTLTIEATSVVNQDLSSDSVTTQFGKLGIGGALVDGVLHAKTSGDPIACFEDTSGNAQVYLRASAGSNTSYVFQEALVSQGAVRWDGTNNQLKLITNMATAALDAVIVDNAGSVGIKVVPTLGTLHVSGKGYFTGQVECNDVDTGAVVCTSLNTTNGNITMGTGDLSCDDLTATGDVDLGGAPTNTYAINTRNSNITMGTGDLSCDVVTCGAINGTNLDCTDIVIDDYIYHSGDLNTYIGFSGADTIVLQTTGVTRLTVNSTGTVVTSGNIQCGANITGALLDVTTTVRGTSMIADGDLGAGIASTNILTNGISVLSGTPASLSFRPALDTGVVHNIWIKIYTGVTVGWIPVFT